MALPLAPPDDLAVPGEASTTARTILSRSLGRVFREVPALLRAHAIGEVREDALTVERALRPLVAEHSPPLASVLRRPHASTLARVLRSAAPGEGSGLTTELCALLAFDLAWLGVLGEEITLRRAPRRILSLTARAALDLPESVSAVTFASGRMTIERPSGRTTLDLDAVAGGAGGEGVTHPYRAVDGEIVLALADNNPLSSIEAHPDKKSPNTVDLGGHEEGEWVASLRDALAIASTFLPAMRADIDLVLQQIVPTGFDAEKHLSCSYREDIGTIYVSLHPTPMTMVEAILHEVSHNKLNALFDLDPVIENPPGELHVSPVRPDPRPLQGVLLAVHAFLPVARLYERMLEADAPAARIPSFRRRFEAIIHGNREGTRVLLRHARPTPLGRGLLGEMARWDEHFRALA